MADRDPAHTGDDTAAGDDDGALELWAGPDGPDEVAEEARARQAPYLATAATAMTGYALWGVAEMAGAVGGVDSRNIVVTGTCVATALAVPVVQSVFRRRIPEGWRRRCWLAGAGAAAWIDATAAYGPSWELTAGLVIAAAAVSARWAAEHELPNPSELEYEPEPQPEPVLPREVLAPRLPEIDISRGAQIEKDWAARVAAGSNPIASGSALTERVRVPNGDEWVITLDPEGRVGCTDLLTQGVRIARALQVNAHNIILERLDGVADREDLAKLTVVTRDLLVDGVSYPGPRYHNGRIPIGLYADGTGEASWTAYDETGVWSGVVSGGQGSGKSTLLAALGLAYRESGEWFVVNGDGDENGLSSRILKRAANDFARGPEQLLQQLEAIEAWYRYRGVLMSGLTEGPDGRPVAMTDPRTQEPVDWIRPCPEYQGLIWIVDELHRSAGDSMLKSVRFIPRVARLVRILRKLGGAVIIGTQSLNAEDFGGDGAFRGMLAQGNLVAMRTENKSEQHTVGSLQLSQSTLRKGGGYAYGGERRAMMRCERSEDMHIWLPGLPARPASPDRSADVYTRHRKVEILDPVAEFEKRQALMAEWETALESGTALPGSEEAKRDVEARTDEVLVGGVGLPGVPVSNVVPIRSRSESTSGPSRPAATPAGPVKVTPLAALGPLPVKARQVLETLQSRPGPWRSRDLVEATGLARPDVSKALAALVDRGLAHRPSDVQGVYAAGPHANIHDRRSS